MFAIEHPSQAKARRESRSRRVMTVLKWEKRSPYAMSKQCDEIADAISRHPGCNAEHLAKELGVESKWLTLPLRKLFAAGRITKSGHHRSTFYSPRKA